MKMIIAKERAQTHLRKSLCLPVSGRCSNRENAAIRKRITCFGCSFPYTDIRFPVIFFHHRIYIFCCVIRLSRSAAGAAVHLRLLFCVCSESSFKSNPLPIHSTGVSGFRIRLISFSVSYFVGTVRPFSAKYFAAPCVIRNCSYGSCKVKIQFIFLVMSQGIDAVVDACYYVVNIILIYIISVLLTTAPDCNGCCVIHPVHMHLSAMTYLV